MASALEQAMTKQLDFYKQYNFPTPELLVPDTDGPNFSSNDYLSLATNAELKQMFMDRLAKQEFILGSRAARHLGGNTSDHVRLEQRLATFFHGPSALLFSSGYDANVGLWSTLPQPNDVILYDEYVHASLHDGMRASKARHALHAFRHNSVEDLRAKLQDIVCTMPSVRDGRASVFVLVDALYSMDGDFAPLKDICSAVEESLPEGSGYVFADEAHSTGVVGEHGRGVTVHLGLEERVLLRVHTFGKGFGCSGAILICPRLVRHFLLYACRGFMFTTAAPRFNILSIECVLDYLESEDGKKLIAKAQTLIAYTRTALERQFKLAADPAIARIPTGSHTRISGYLSPVFPIFSANAAGLAEFLTAHGFRMRHMVFPVVAVGTERVRLSTQAGNTLAEIDELVGLIGRWLKMEKMKMIMAAEEDYNIQKGKL